MRFSARAPTAVLASQDKLLRQPPYLLGALPNGHHIDITYLSHILVGRKEVAVNMRWDNLTINGKEVCMV